MADSVVSRFGCYTNSRDVTDEACGYGFRGTECIPS
jgi:hypothetical protein